MNHDSAVELPNFDIFNYLDKATPGNAEIAFTNKYIDKIVTINDFDKFMPEKITDHYKNNFNDEENPDVDYF
ncbi:MAG: hypothetical protein MJ200_01745 [Mycoplasmoidaceae bacterium]|nr:hypothetical protein [Mycoplasmoidaceae bacterium]